MKSIKFPFINAVYGKDQEGVEELPVHNTEEGLTITAFRLTEEELKEIAETGVIFISILTHGHRLHPIYSTVVNPFENEMEACECGDLELMEHMTTDVDEGTKTCRNCMEDITGDGEVLKIVN